MKILIKNPNEKLKIIPVPQNMILPTLNTYLKKKELPPVTPQELAKLLTSVEKVKEAQEVFTLVEVRSKDGKIVKVVM